MPASPVSYDDFAALNGGGGFSNENGAWHYDRSSYDVNVGAQPGNWCSDVSYCITAWMYPSASLNYYSVSFYANISVDMNQYPNLDTLKCTFSYKPLWISTKTAAGIAIPLKVLVGSQSFSDSLPAGNFDRVFTTNQWEGDTYSHDAEIALSRSNGVTTAYIPLAINITWPRQTGDYINYYVKSTTFKINDQRTGGSTSSSIAPGSSSTPGPVTVKENKTTTAVAGVLGALALIALVVIGFLLLKLRRLKQEKGETDTMSERPRSQAVTSPANVTPFVTPVTMVQGSQPPHMTPNHSFSHTSIPAQTSFPAQTPSHSGTDPFRSSDLVTTLSSPHPDSASLYPPSSAGLPYRIPPVNPSSIRTGTKGSDLPPYSQ